MKYIKFIYSMVTWIVIIALLITLAYVRDAQAYINDLEEIVDDRCGSVADVVDESRINYYDWGF